MKTPLHDIVHKLALDIINASATDDIQAGADAYEALSQLCHDQEGTELDHPLQWEALGDFSDKPESAMQAYEKGLACAEKLALSEYLASIRFAMAESCYAQNDLAKARELAIQANTDAATTQDQELKTAISEWLNEISAAQ